MRGFAKRLKPLVTPTLVRAMEGIGPVRGYALFMWYHGAYTRMTTAVERLDDEGATMNEIADALDALDLDPAPDGVDATLADIIRGEAQDLVEAAVVKTMAAREKKRAQRIRKALDIEAQARDLADDLSDDRPDDEDCPGCPDCPGDNGGQRGQAGQPTDPSPGPPSLSSSMTSMRQSINARERARKQASRPSGLTGRDSTTPASTSRKCEVPPQNDWVHFRNPDGRDPVDLAIEVSRGDPADEDARRCWGAYLRDIGVDEFLDVLHVYEADSGDCSRLRNPAAVLNDAMAARRAMVRLRGGPPPGRVLSDKKVVSPADDGAARGARLTKGAATAAPDVERKNDEK